MARQGAGSEAGGRQTKGLAVSQSYDMFILMSTIERFTVTLTSEMAESVRRAVQAGEYASSSELIRDALRDWRHKRALQEQELQELRAKVREGMDDIEAGRVQDFDPERIIEKGERKLQKPESSV
jgi:antitoxin ParD1/3/4